MFSLGASFYSHSRLVLGCMVVGTGLCSAQVKPAPPPADASAQVLSGFDLTDPQKARLSQLLPHSFPKLQKRLPFHSVVLGDAVAGMEGYDADAGNVLKGYPARFLEQLAGQFFYSGGVRAIKPQGGHPSKLLPTDGPEITLRSLAGRNRMAVDALQLWGAYGANPAPDLVIIGYGSGEAASGFDPGTFGAAIAEIIKTVKAAGADVLLAGPTLTIAEPVESSLAATRVYTAELRTVADRMKVPFFDLGDLSTLVKLEAIPGDAPSPPEEVFEQLAAAYSNHFRWDGVEDYTLPQASLQQKLGRQMFRTLLNGEPTVPWGVRGGVAAFSSADQFKLTFSVQNPGTEPQRLIVLPLVPSRWVPQDATPEVTMKAGKNRKVEVPYERKNTDMSIRWNAFPSSDGNLHLPVLVSDGHIARVEDIVASVQPVSLTWKPQTQFGLEKSFTIPHTIVNNTGAAITGADWVATLGNEKRSGKIDLAPGVAAVLPISFDLPADAAESRRVDPLNVTLFANGVLMRWERNVQISRNIGLKQVVPLIPAATGKDPSPPVTVKCEADSSALYLTVDIGELVLEDDTTGTALFATLGLDGRTFGKRLGPGGIEPVRYRLGVADGYGETSKIAPWAFGSGYAATFEPGAMPIRLQSSPTGSRRISFVVPRSYLYLHDFTPGNGNSHLGISLNLSFYRQPVDGAAAGGFPDTLSYSLMRNGRHPSDAESLTVLELSEKPTQRWTVIHW